MNKDKILNESNHFMNVLLMRILSNSYSFTDYLLNNIDNVAKRHEIDIDSLVSYLMAIVEKVAEDYENDEVKKIEKLEAFFEICRKYPEHVELRFGDDFDPENLIIPNVYSESLNDHKKYEDWSIFLKSFNGWQIDLIFRFALRNDKACIKQLHFLGAAIERILEMADLAPLLIEGEREALRESAGKLLVLANSIMAEQNDQTGADAFAQVMNLNREWRERAAPHRCMLYLRGDMTKYGAITKKP